MPFTLPQFDEEIDPLTGLPYARPDIMGASIGFAPPPSLMTAPPPAAVPPPVIQPREVELDDPGIAVPPPPPPPPPPPAASAPTVPEVGLPPAVGGVEEPQVSSPSPVVPPSPPSAPAGDLRAYAREAARKAGIDPDLFERQIQQESSFNPNAGSSAGAQGIAQIVPKWHPGVNPWNPTEALDYAANLMARHLKTYGGDMTKALVAYNGGGGAVAQYERGTPYEETQIYLANILGGRTMTPGPPVEGVPPREPDIPPPGIPRQQMPNQPMFPWDTWQRPQIDSPAGDFGQIGTGLGKLPGEIAAIPGNLAAGAGRAFGAAGTALGAAYQDIGSMFDPTPPASNDDPLERLGTVGRAGLNTIGGLLQPINPEHYIGADASNALAMTPLAPLMLPANAGKALRLAAAAGEMVTNLDVRGPGTSVLTPPGYTSEALGMSFGAPPPRGNAAKTDNIAPDGTLPRTFQQSVADSPLGAAYKMLLEEDIDRYTPITNPGTLSAAARRIDADPSAALNRVLNQTPATGTLEIDAEAMVLLARAAAAGDVDLLNRLTRVYARSLTESGQRVQLASTIDKISSPQGALLLANQVIHRAIRRRGGTDAAEDAVGKTVAKQETNLINERAAARQAEVDETVRLTPKPSKRIVEAIEQHTSMKYNDFAKDMKALLKDTEPGPRARGSKPGELRFMTQAEYEIDPDDLARFYARGQEIMTTLPPGAERDAAKTALLQEIDEFRRDMVKTENLQRRAAAKLQRMEERLANRHESQEFKLAEGNAQKALASAEEEHAAQLREIQRIEKGEATAEDVDTKAIASAVEREQALQVKAEKRQAADAEIARLKQEQAAFLKAESDLKAQKKSAEKTEWKRIDDEARASKKEALRVEKAWKSLEKQKAEAPIKAWAALEKQKAPPEANALLSLAKQKVRAAQHDLDYYKDTTTYFTSAEARVAKEIVAREAHEQLLSYAKSKLNSSGVEVGPVYADHIFRRAKGIEAMEKGSPERYIAEQQFYADINNLAPGEWNKFGWLLNDLPRGLKTSYDISAPFRQGGAVLRDVVRLGWNQPRLWASAWGPMLRALVDKDFVLHQDAVFHTRKHYQAGEKAHLFLGDLGPNATIITKEEQFLGNLGVFKHFPRLLQPGAYQDAYVTFLNKIRVGMFDNQMEQWAKYKVEKTPEELAAYAQFVNAFTGRGEIKALEGIAPALNLLFFAAKFTIAAPLVHAQGIRAVGSIVSAGRMPGSYTPDVARAIAKSWASASLSTIALVGLAKAMYPDNVQMDPEKPQFGSFRLGDTYIDLTFGQAQYVTLVARLLKAAGERETNPKGMDDAIGSFMRKKLSPIAGAVWNLSHNTDFLGQPIYGPQAGEMLFERLPDFAENVMETAGVAEGVKPALVVGNVLMELYGPLILGTLIESSVVEGLPGNLAATAGSGVGITINSYTTMSDAQRAEAIKLHPEYASKKDPYAELSKSEKEKVNTTPEVVRLQTEMDLRPRSYNDWQMVSVAMEQYETGKATLERDLKANIRPENGMPGATGKQLDTLIRDFKKNRFQLGRSIFTDQVKAAMDKDKPERPLSAELFDAYWSAEPAEDEFGNLDFTVQEQQRKAILEQAVAAGIRSEVILDRGTIYEDPVVREAVAARDRDYATMRPYFDMPNTLSQQTPAFAEISRHHDQLERSPLALQPMPGYPMMTQLEYWERTTPMWVYYNRSLEYERKRLRMTNKDVDDAGVRWGRWQISPHRDDDLRPAPPPKESIGMESKKVGQIPAAAGIR